jgi:hypothetical protein
MADVKCDGSSFAKAIVVKAPTDHAGIGAQHDYIAKHFGKWRSIGVKSVEHDKRLFDIMRFTTVDGKNIFFTSISLTTTANCEWLPNHLIMRCSQPPLHYIALLYENMFTASHARSHQRWLISFSLDEYAERQAG